MVGKLKKAAWLLVAALLAVAVVRALVPKPASVSLVTTTRGPLRVTVTEEGRTRVKARYTLSAPVNGMLERIVLDPGAAVEAGAALARIAPRDSAPLDARARSEAVARRSEAAAAKRRASVAIDEAQVAHEFARTEAERIQKLVEAGTLPPRDLEVARKDERVRATSLESARFGAEVARAELELAEATLGIAASGRARDIVTVTAPTRGRILRVVQRDGVVAAGAALLELADPAALEVVVDLLTTDAARIPEAAPVVLRDWGGEGTLSGRVRLVEPSAFTKVSALGVEEQRVAVVIDLDDRAKAGARMGDGFRIEVEITLWESEAVTKVPVSALFRDGDHWAAFAVVTGRASRRTLEIGHKNGDEAEVLAGLAPGDQAIAYPVDTLTDGAKVVARAGPR
jgi:HlyD family secretion protein